MGTTQSLSNYQVQELHDGDPDVMVYHRPSTGCQNCRQRHIKCDESRPACRKCIARGMVCPGYRSRDDVLFKDQTQSIVQRQTILSAKRREQRLQQANDEAGASAIPQRLDPIRSHIEIDPLQASVCYFFRQFVEGRHNHPSVSRGHLDFLIPLYAAAAPTSALALSTLAMASQALQMYQPNGPTLTGQVKLHLTACQALQTAISHPSESLRDETLLAVLCLDFAEHFARRGSRRTATRMHVDGALALVRHRGPQSFNSPVSRALLAAVRSNVLFQKLWFHDKKSRDAVWSLPDIETAESNPAVALQQILGRLLVLQDKILDEETVELARDPSVRIREVEAIHLQLRDWHTRGPKSWTEIATASANGSGRQGSMIAGVPSAQIAYVMGEWHCTMLMSLRLRHALNEMCDQSIQTYSIAQHLTATAISVVASLRSLLEWFQQTQTDDHDPDKFGSRNVVTSTVDIASAYNQGFVYQDDEVSRRWYMINIVRWASNILLNGIKETANLKVLPEQLQYLDEQKTRLASSFRTEQWVQQHDSTFVKPIAVV